MKVQKIQLIAFIVLLSVFFCVQAADSLYVDPSGNVGVGTSTPTTRLHVEALDNAAIFVKNTTAVGAERAMFTLANKGKTRFLIANGPNLWTFDNAGTSFQINKAGTGAPVEFEVHDNGDGHFGGDVYANEVLLTSSRDSKTDFETVDSTSILERLGELDIMSWRYKEDETSDRHIGPVAEDFQDVFDLGDGSHISAVDIGGIAFAAIKGLRDNAEQHAAKMESLQTENDRLLLINADLEKRLRKLEELLLPSDLASND